jgi:hypothetical protein
MENEKYKRIVKNINNEKEYEILEDLLYRVDRNGRIRVLRDYEFEGLMYIVHDHEISGHFGKDATYDRIKGKFWWENMTKDIERYVRSCDKCQKRGKPKGKHELHSIEVDEPFARIGIDIVGPLPESIRGNRYIIVAMDYFTKWPEARALKEATAKEVSKFIYEEIVCRHGCPKRILSDRGTHFNNKVVEELLSKFNVKHGFSTPYHPKTNGLVERFNKTLCESLAKLGEEDWDEHIAPILFAYRTKIQKSTKMEPFYIVYGREARLPIDRDENKMTLLERAKCLIEELPKIRWKAKANIKESQYQQKYYHDNKIKIKQQFKIGDQVLLYDAAKEKQWSGKLKDKWKGPYYIHEVIINGSYKLKELDGRILRTPVNGELLKIYNDRRSFEPVILID